MNSSSEGTGTGSGARRGKRLWGVLAVTALMSAVLVANSQVTSAASSKTINAACAGVTQADKDLLGAVVPGGVLSTPLEAIIDAPPFVEPQQSGVGVSVTWNMNLPADFADTAIGFGISQMDVVDINTDVTIDGPDDYDFVIPGRPPNTTITLQAGQPITSTFGPFSTTLDDVPNGGIIKLRSEEFRFTVKLTVAGAAQEVKVVCSTATTIGTIPIKVAGSPDIVQPIEVSSNEGQPSTVDVLNEFVTNGTTKDGVEQQVDPSTLKILEGDAQIVAGKVVATGAAAGTSTDVVFEVCAGTVEIAPAEEGITEVQELRFFYDPSTGGTKRQMGVRMGLDGESSPIIWSIDGPLVPNPTPAQIANETPPEDAAPGWVNWWQLAVNNLALFTTHSYPTAAEVQAGLEAIPGIGQGNVTVTRGDIINRLNAPEGVTLEGSNQYRPYTVTFAGELAGKSVAQLIPLRLYSFFPAEVRDSLLAVAGSLGGGEGEGDGGGEPAEPTAPIPDGKTAQEYVNDLNFKAGTQLNNGDFVGALATLDLMFTVIGENTGDLIDVNEATALLGQLFQASPEVITTTNGADPVDAQFQELCSQGVVTLTTAGADVAAATNEQGGAAVEGTTENQGGASLAIAG
ncbi:MAG: hypothetical protein GY812_08355 [Actinomycetia bacterium]|nr:hypothetical protein [Actinomycetes bacterium]